MRPSVRAASISPDHRLPLVQTGVQHRLAVGLFPDTRSTLAVTCRCSNRPRVSRRVSRCLPGPPGPAGRAWPTAPAPYPPAPERVLSKQGQFRTGLCSCRAALRPVPRCERWGPWCFGAGGYYCDCLPEPSGLPGQPGWAGFAGYGSICCYCWTDTSIYPIFLAESDSLLVSQRYGSKAQ